VAWVGGVVKTILVEEGQYVRTNQAVVQLKDERLALEVRRAEVTEPSWAVSPFLPLLPC
jgi:multidrug efflux pump subunit AcrA (membrane-fusion protein)